MHQLGGRVAVVTGAASGIGRSLATLLAAEKMSVVLADIEEAALATTTAALASDGATVEAIPTDVSDAASVQALADAAVGRFGAVHVVCNNAAVAGRFARTYAASVEEWRWVLEVNVMGVVHGIRSFVPVLLEQDEGHIVNTGSAACFEALPGMGLYAASKHAVLGLSEALQRELHARGAPIGVTVLMPGGVVRSGIMTGERNWLDRLGDLPPADDDPLPTLIRNGFTAAVDGGVDPELCARAGVDAIKSGAYLACDDADLLREWSAHHAAQGVGQRPTWP